MNRCSSIPVHNPRSQRGVALLVVLIILLLATLIGLAAMRGTLLQERMTANLYDRSIAFQAAERALREAEAAVKVNGTLGYDCDLTKITTPCPLPDANTGTVAGEVWANASAPPAGSLEAGTPQYIIQRLGLSDTAGRLGLPNNAANKGYGASGGSVVTQANYRIFARSHDPATVDRAIVILQSNIVTR